MTSTPSRTARENWSRKPRALQTWPRTNSPGRCAPTDVHRRKRISRHAERASRFRPRSPAPAQASRALRAASSAQARGTRHAFATWSPPHHEPARSQPGRRAKAAEFGSRPTPKVAESSNARDRHKGRQEASVAGTLQRADRRSHRSQANPPAGAPSRACTRTRPLQVPQVPQVPAAREALAANTIDPSHASPSPREARTSVALFLAHGCTRHHRLRTRICPSFMVETWSLGALASEAGVDPPRMAEGCALTFGGTRLAYPTQPSVDGCRSHGESRQWGRNGEDVDAPREALKGSPPSSATASPVPTWLSISIESWTTMC